jgi:hypothetical protein
MNDLAPSDMLVDMSRTMSTHDTMQQPSPEPFPVPDGGLLDQSLRALFEVRSSWESSVEESKVVLDILQNVSCSLRATCGTNSCLNSGWMHRLSTTQIDALLSTGC